MSGLSKLSGWVGQRWVKHLGPHSKDEGSRSLLANHKAGSLHAFSCSHTPVSAHFTDEKTEALRMGETWPECTGAGTHSQLYPTPRFTL